VDLGLLQDGWCCVLLWWKLESTKCMDCSFMQTRDDEKWMKHTLGYALCPQWLFLMFFRLFDCIRRRVCCGVDCWVYVWLWSSSCSLGIEEDWMSEEWVGFVVACRFWENNRVRLDYRPVHMNTLDNEVEVFPPKARVY
jgi:hypothetical protein